MSRKPIQSMMLATLAVMALASDSNLNGYRYHRDERTNLTIPGGGNYFGSRGLNMRAHNVRAAIKRHAMNKVARASRKRNGAK